ncbi:hypothetical protein PO909_032215 [Leuciscus waleckii]
MLFWLQKRAKLQVLASAGDHVCGVSACKSCNERNERVWNGATLRCNRMTRRAIVLNRVSKSNDDLLDQVYISLPF